MWTESRTRALSAFSALVGLLLGIGAIVTAIASSFGTAVPAALVVLGIACLPTMFVLISCIVGDAWTAGSRKEAATWLVGIAVGWTFLVWSGAVAAIVSAARAAVTEGLPEASSSSSDATGVMLLGGFALVAIVLGTAWWCVDAVRDDREAHGSVPSVRRRSRWRRASAGSVR